MHQVGFGILLGGKSVQESKGVQIGKSAHDTLWLLVLKT